MTPELKDIAAKLEAEYVELCASMLDLRTRYDGLADEIRPLEARQREIEAAMDEIKGRHKELSERLGHLRKAVS